MKASKISLIAAVITGVMLAYSPALRAQDAKEGKDASKKEGRPGGERWAAGSKERVERMAEELKLNDEQKKKVETLFKEQGEKMRGMRDATQEERQAKGKAMREEMTKKLKEILTTEQFEKWQKMRPQGRPGGPGGQKRGPQQGGDDKK